MKNIVPILGFILPMAIIIGLNSLFRAGNHESASYSNISIVIAGVFAIGFGYVFERYGKTLIGMMSFKTNKWIEDENEDMKRTVIKNFTYLIIAMIFSFFFLDKGLQRKTKIQNCIKNNNTKQEIQECIDNLDGGTQYDDLTD